MDAQWLVWLGVALVAGVIEIFTLSLVFAMVAGGALAAAVVAALTGSVVASVLAFAASTGLLIFVVRPPLLQYSRRNAASTATGVAALVGRRAEVIEPVTPRGGQVKLAGELWSARADAPGSVLEIGSVVYVAAIEGATAVVTPLPPGTPAFPGGSSRPDPTHPSDRPEN